MLPIETLSAFDAFLGRQGLRFEGVIIGGSALALLGVTTRQTRDCDVLDPLLPDAIVGASRDFAREQRAAGLDLADGWLNNGPRSLTSVLPVAWRDRLVEVYRGAALLLLTLGRSDLLCTKLFALCDRGFDLPDCLALAPSASELLELEPWVSYQDANPDRPAHVRATLQDLGRRLGHGV
jgi:hypothetical protein